MLRQGEVGALQIKVRLALTAKDRLHRTWLFITVLRLVGVTAGLSSRQWHNLYLKQPSWARVESGRCGRPGRKVDVADHLE